MIFISNEKSDPDSEKKQQQQQQLRTVELSNKISLNTLYVHGDKNHLQRWDIVTPNSAESIQDNYPFKMSELR